MKNLCTAMVAAFPEIEGATKDSTNPHFKSKYADLTSVVDAIKPAITKHGLFFSQLCHEAPNGVCVETVVSHSSGEQMSFGRLFVPAAKLDPQGFGSALTYARRYSLMAAFGVAPEDDDGNSASKAVANDTGLRQQLQESVKQPTKRDAPFPQGPARNRTELKTLGRAFWRDVEAAGDPDELDILLDTNQALVTQIRADLPTWMTGGERDGEKFEGLDTVIENKRTEFANDAWKRNPLAAG